MGTPALSGSVQRGGPPGGGDWDVGTARGRIPFSSCTRVTLAPLLSKCVSLRTLSTVGLVAGLSWEETKRVAQSNRLDAV